MPYANLTKKQALFVKEYLVDLNGKQAAIRAGFSPATAEVYASKLLSKGKVADEVQKAMDKRSEKVGVTAERVLSELAKIGFADIRNLFASNGALKRMEDLDDHAAASLASVEVVTRKVPGGDENEVEHIHKVKMWDKRAALVDMGKHLGMFTDKVEHGVSNDFADLMKQIDGKSRPIIG